MMINQITHKTTINAIIKHNITEEELMNIHSLEELKLFIRRASRRLWYKHNREYFKNKYQSDYKERVLQQSKERTLVKQYMKELPHAL